MSQIKNRIVVCISPFFDFPTGILNSSTSSPNCAASHKFLYFFASLQLFTDRIFYEGHQPTD